MNESPNISSFVIRFVQETTSGGHSAYRGTIRHVQTNQELVFTKWKEATAFIDRFIPLDDANPLNQANQPS